MWPTSPGHGGAGRIDTDELDDGVYEECQNDGRQHAESDQYGGLAMPGRRCRLVVGARLPIARLPIARLPVARLPIARLIVGVIAVGLTTGSAVVRVLGGILGGIAVVGSSGDPLRGTVPDGSRADSALTRKAGR